MRACHILRELPQLVSALAAALRRKRINCSALLAAARTTNMNTGARHANQLQAQKARLCPLVARDAAVVTRETCVSSNGRAQSKGKIMLEWAGTRENRFGAANERMKYPIFGDAHFNISKRN